jgi:hypothetical protein
MRSMIRCRGGLEFTCACLYKNSCQLFYFQKCIFPYALYLETRMYDTRSAKKRHNNQDSVTGGNSAWKDVTYNLIGSMCTVVLLVGLVLLKSR